ncbi:MAG TPA: hypothetical protein VKT53_03275 [Candidatus Acidoferrum sp.]|nr:hypothetical protein [Candidatus Acidoferrum sp.]
MAALKSNITAQIVSIVSTMACSCYRDYNLQLTQSCAARRARH